ncbi:MAG TPA: hypothetical protein PLO73_15040, partial [Spirochaetota bacterium]|nr:hypothetical protein [Spirochaetota bacterium]
TLGVVTPGNSRVFKPISANLLYKHKNYVGSDNTTFVKPGISSVFVSANLPQKWPFYVTSLGWRHQNMPYFIQFSKNCLITALYRL